MGIISKFGNVKSLKYSKSKAVKQIFIVILGNVNVSKRITIIIGEDIDKKLRLIQSKQIAKTNSSISYSQVLNEAIRKQLK